MINRHTVFQRISWVPSLIVSGLPVAGYCMANEFIWPPLGSLSLVAAGCALPVILLIGLMPKLWESEQAAKLSSFAGVVVAIVALVIYSYFFQTYVRRVVTPENGIQYRTVGSQRSPEALDKFAASTDEQILRAVGLNDEDIRRMWVPSSVDDADRKLFFSCLLFLCATNLSIRSFALFQNARSLVTSSGENVTKVNHL